MHLSCFHPHLWDEAGVILPRAPSHIEPEPSLHRFRCVASCASTLQFRLMWKTWLKHMTAAETLWQNTSVKSHSNEECSRCETVAGKTRPEMNPKTTDLWKTEAEEQHLITQSRKYWACLNSGVWFFLWNKWWPFWRPLQTKDAVINTTENCRKKSEANFDLPVCTHQVQCNFKMK